MTTFDVSILKYMRKETSESNILASVKKVKIVKKMEKLINKRQLLSGAVTKLISAISEPLEEVELSFI